MTSTVYSDVGPGFPCVPAGKIVPDQVVSIERSGFGLNIGQGVLAALLGYLVDEKFQSAMVYGGATLLSTALPGYYIKNVLAEKYIAEPILSGVLAVGGMHLMGHKSDHLEHFGKGATIGAGSAGIYTAFLSMSSYNNNYKPIVQQIREAPANNNNSSLFIVS